MNTLEAMGRSVGTPGEKSPKRPLSAPFTPLFLGDCLQVLFIHYEVNADVLARLVPFELDLFQGRAFVSLVAFTMRRLRPSFGGFPAWALFAPISTHRFLNVRTCVRRAGETGIYFISEFVSNRFCVPLGRPTFGLPYRFARLTCQHLQETGNIAGEVKTAGGTLGVRFDGAMNPHAALQICRRDSLEEFLLERYTAFTARRERRRLFRIWHEPWLHRDVSANVNDAGLLASTGEWWAEARLVGANFSPGVRDVCIGRPHKLTERRPRRRLTVFFDV